MSRRVFARPRHLFGLMAALFLTSLPVGQTAWAAIAGACNCGGAQKSPPSPVFGQERVDPSIPTTGLYVNDRHFTGANGITVQRREVSYLDEPREQSCLTVGSNTSMVGRKKPSYCAYTDVRTQAVEERATTRFIDPKMDIYYSDAPAWSMNKKPVVVLIHGGNFRTNGKRNAGADNWKPNGESCDALPAALANGDPNSWPLLARSYVCAGFMAVSVNYRMRDMTDAPYTPAAALADRKLMYTGAARQPYDDRQWDAVRNGTIVEALDDVNDAILYLKKNADVLGIDATRIVTLGASAGGALSMMNAVRANELTPDAEGRTAQVRAALSTGAALADETNRILNPAWKLTPDVNDTPIQLYHSNPCDCGTGMGWENNVKPTQDFIRGRVNGVRQGPPCRVLPHNLVDARGQQEYTHTMPLALHDDVPGLASSQYALHAPTVRRFLYRQLQLCSLRGEAC